MKPCFVFPVVCLALFFQGAALAAEEVAMQFRGGLIAPPPCTINAGAKIDVDFGSRVGIKKWMALTTARRSITTLIVNRGRALGS